MYMQEAVLCIITKGNKILLMEKLRGFGKGLISAPGGKIDKDEIPEQAAIREVKEEVNVDVTDLKYHGKIEFFSANSKEWIVHVFSTKTVKGSIKNTEEAIPEWIDIKKIPYDKMWADTKHWIPVVLQGKKFNAVFHFNKNWEKITSFRINLSKNKG